MAAEELLPEEVLVAVLHQVGRDVRLTDDARLAQLFDEAAASSPLFAPFRSQRQYSFSRLLSNALQTLDLGGSIVRENAPTKYFRISTHTAGPYGESKVKLLGDEEKTAVRTLAEKIRDTFLAKPISTAAR